MSLLPPNRKPVAEDVATKAIVQIVLWTTSVFMYLVIVVYVPPMLYFMP